MATLLAVVPFLGPDSIRLGPAFSWTAFMLQAAGAASVAAVWFVPRLGGPVLVAFIYLNVSQVLVTQHQLPSSLRVLVLVLLIVAWRERSGAAFLQVAISPLTLLLGLYVLLLLVTSTLARDVGLADASWLEALKGWSLLILLATLISSRQPFRLAMWSMAGGAALLASIGICQHLTGSFDSQFWGFGRIKQAHIVGEALRPRIAGPLGDPNFFAQILLMALPLAVVLAWRERGEKLRVLALVSSGIIAAGIVLTYSRGAGLAVAVQAFLLWATSRRRVRVGALAALTMLVALVFLPQDFTRRLTTVRQLMPGESTVLDPDSSFEERKLYTQVAWQMFLDRPLLGVGAGNYTEFFDEYADRVGSVVRFSSISDRYYPHNLYLEIAAETGLVGLWLFLVILVTSLFYLERARWYLLISGDDLLAALARALEISLAGYLISSLFLHGHFIRYLWLLFAFAVALDLIARGAFARRDGAVTSPEAGSLAAIEGASRGGQRW